MNEATGTRFKVGRVIKSYGLSELGEELERLWTGDDTEKWSLRELAELFNKRVLRAAMETEGGTPMEGEVNYLYSTLTDDQASAGERTQTERKLKRTGVDTDQLQRDFVSHQAIYTYLTKHRGAQRSPKTDVEVISNIRQSVSRLQNKLVSVTEHNLESLKNTDRIVLGSFKVLVNVNVYCEDCGKQYSIQELLDTRGCECGSNGGLDGLQS